MFAITADQIDSRHHDDLVADQLEQLSRIGGAHLLLPPDRAAGDELQVVTDDAATALRLVLHLRRSEQWSVGLGIGEVRHPLPETTRAVTGSAFELARSAVEQAKRRPLHFALAVEEGRNPDAATLQTMVELLLQLRSRRSAHGWQLAELLDAGLTQKAAAEQLGITAQAASLRAHAAQLRLDRAAQLALTNLLADSDASRPPSAK